MKRVTQRRVAAGLGVTSALLALLAVFTAVIVAAGDTRMAASEVPPIETGCPGCARDQLEVHRVLFGPDVAAMLSDLRARFDSDVTRLDSGPDGAVVTVAADGVALDVCRWLAERYERIRVHDVEGFLIAATHPWDGDCRPVHS